MKKLLPLCAASLSLACATANFTPTNASPRPLAARPMEQVEVFTSTQPEKPFVEVGLITGEPFHDYKTGAPAAGAAYLVDIIRKEAGKQGCDGVIVKPGAGDAYQGTCIVYK